MSKPSAVLESVLLFIKGGNLRPSSKPGFNHSLQLSYNQVSKSRFSFSNNALTYRYKLSEHVPEASVGLLTALMDELSTNACFAVGQPSPPGLSLQMQTELLDTEALQATKEVDIVNQVTKLGRTVSYTRSEYLCAETQRLLAFSSHVKYMPTGSRLMDFVLTNKMAYQLYESFFVARKPNPELFEEKPIREVIQSHLEYHGLGRATFHCTREHTNPMGSMHGGCHAMVMEKVGTSHSKAELQYESVTLEAIQIDYLRAAKTGSIDVVCETIGFVGDNTINIRIMIMKHNKVLSEGKLRFSKAASQRLSKM